MVTNELSEAAVEINSIFENLSPEVLEKIPENFQNFMKRIASNTYNFTYDKNKSLVEQSLKPRTKGIIALIYRDYLCSEEERQDYIEYCDMVLYKKQNTLSEVEGAVSDSEKIISEDTQINSEIVPTIYQKDSLIQRIINKIKSFFKK